MSLNKLKWAKEIYVRENFISKRLSMTCFKIKKRGSKLQKSNIN